MCSECMCTACVCVCVASLAHFLSPLSEHSQSVAKEKLTHQQQLISNPKYKKKTCYPRLSLLPAGSDRSRFIAQTRKPITPLSYCSNTDVCSRCTQRPDCSSPVSCLCCISWPCKGRSTFLISAPLPACQQTALSSHSASVCVGVWFLPG